MITAALAHENLRSIPKKRSYKRAVIVKPRLSDNSVANDDEDIKWVRNDAVDHTRDQSRVSGDH